MWKALLHHLVVAGRTIGLAVVPTTLFLFVLTGERTLERLTALTATVFVLVNANFLILNGFYHSFWDPLAKLRRRLAYSLFIALVLPFLGLAGAVLGLTILF